MKKTTYNKLVRDKIPEIISATGKIFHTKILSGDEYNKMLDEKLQEELQEYLESKDVEELADILEVIYAITESKGVSIKDLEKMRNDKARKRGAFKSKILLIDVIED